MDQSLRIWDTATLQCEHHLENAHDRSLHSLCFHEHAPVVFTGSRDHCIKLWDLRSGTNVSSIQGHLGSVTCLSVNDYRLLSGGGFNRGPGDVEVLSTDSTLRLWDIRMNRQLWENRIVSEYDDEGQYITHDEPVLCVNLLRDRILSGHGDGSVRCCDFSVSPVLEGY